MVAGVVAAGVLASSANAAILSLAAEGGGGVLNLAPGDAGYVHIILEIQAIDTGFAYSNVFLNDGFDEEDDHLAVEDVIQGFTEPAGDLTYDRTAFELPADFSHDLGNEYGLIMGRTDDTDWGPGIYTLDTLTVRHLSNEVTGQHPITFEKGARAPQLVTADFVGYPWGLGLAGVQHDGVGTTSKGPLEED